MLLDIFEQDNIIGHGSLKSNQGIIITDNIFPEPIIHKINIEKNNKISNELKLQIEKLKEYRQSIISEAVTGKIDVSDWQPNKQQEA